MFVQNFIKLSAAVHELSCSQALLPYLAMVKNQVIRSCEAATYRPLTYDLTLKINRVRAVVKGHVHATFHRAKCSGS